MKRKDYTTGVYTPLPASSKGDDSWSTVVSMCCGAFHTLCIGKYTTIYYDSVFARGKGDQGQLGIGEVIDHIPEAKFVKGQLYEYNTVTQVKLFVEGSASLL